MIDPQLQEETPAVTAKTLRQFAALSMVILGALAAWQYYGRHHETTAWVLGIIGLTLGVAGLARPESIRPVFTTAVAITTPIGRLVSVIMLGAIYYVLFTPVAFLFRMFGRDALQLKRPARPSHWLQKPAVTDPRSYMRQS
jgi:hypothetical protein